MNMNHAQRLILSNQYEILIGMHPERAAHYRRCQTIIERGYCLELLELEKSFGHLTEETCREVHSTLEMFHALKVSYENLPATEAQEIAANRLAFNGYSRGHEKALADYVCFVLDEEGKFAALGKSGKALDAELAMQEKYQRMLAAWQECPRHYKLSIQEIRKILNA
ncbi:MAG: YfbU family protein [Aeromonadaceae bacterium]|nr:YfbU family protein [Aeromonadaceae bacterium]